MTVTDSRFDLLAKLMDVAGMRHRVLAQNVANANTPGYRRLDVSFEDTFAQQVGRHQEMAALGTAPKVVQAGGGTERFDGNNVDVDIEMGRLNKNALLYSAYAQILSNRIAMMRSAITGR